MISTETCSLRELVTVNSQSQRTIRDRVRIQHMYQITVQYSSNAWTVHSTLNSWTCILTKWQVLHGCWKSKMVEETAYDSLATIIVSMLDNKQSMCHGHGLMSNWLTTLSSARFHKSAFSCNNPAGLYKALQPWTLEIILKAIEMDWNSLMCLCAIHEIQIRCES